MKKLKTLIILTLCSAQLAFGSEPADPNWNPAADVKEDGIINIFDLATVGLAFGNEC